MVVVVVVVVSFRRERRRFLRETNAATVRRRRRRANDLIVSRQADHFGLVSARQVCAFVDAKTNFAVRTAHRQRRARWRATGVQNLHSLRSSTANDDCTESKRSTLSAVRSHRSDDTRWVFEFFPHHFWWALLSKRVANVFVKILFRAVILRRGFFFTLMIHLGAKSVVVKIIVARVGCFSLSLSLSLSLFLWTQNIPSLSLSRSRGGRLMLLVVVRR